MKFEKISIEQYIKDNSSQNMENIIDDYNNIKLPQRKTFKSAGYDIFSPIRFSLESGKTIKIATGIKCFIDDGYFLSIVPRSSLGFKYRLQLDNTFGVIDCDYVESDNEGHIFVKITNDSKFDNTLVINQGDAICQGIFIKYGITEDDNLHEKMQRNGGFGSTNNIV